MIALLFHDVYVHDPGESGFSSAGADRYKLSLAQFDAQLSGVAAASPGEPCLTTFDDGGVSFYSIVADRLETRGWRGHCFISTDFIGRPGFLDGRQIRELLERGHLIGSHSASHPNRLDQKPDSDILREWTESRDRLEQLLGRQVSTASIPGGCLSRSVATAAAEAGYTALYTSEPTTSIEMRGACALIGRFAIRASSAADLSRQLITSPVARWNQRLSWNTKSLLKPLLGSTYGRIADLLSRPPGTVSQAP
jgi:peptidoglycan/xylan/chitin deacetylase (PgdA/CDA1 family)